MTDMVLCRTHGEQEATYVCHHIVGSLDTGCAVGFHWPQGSTSRRPDAWCTACERVRVAEGGNWTAAAMAFVEMKVLCGVCYDRAKSIWLEARQVMAATKQ